MLSGYDSGSMSDFSGCNCKSVSPTGVRRGNRDLQSCAAGTNTTFWETFSVFAEFCKQRQISQNVVNPLYRFESVVNYLAWTLEKLLYEVGLLKIGNA